MVFVNLGPFRCVLIREVSSFQRVNVWSLLTWGPSDVSSLERCPLSEGECVVFVNLGPFRCVLIREVSSFQRVRCVVFVNLGPCRCALIRKVSSFVKVKLTMIFVNLGACNYDVHCTRVGNTCNSQTSDIF